MLKAILSGVIFVSASIASPVVAQMDGEAAAEQMAERAQSTATRLGVSDEQRPQVEAILATGAEKRASIMKSFGFDDDATPELKRREKRDLRDQLKELSEDTTQKLAAVLTEDQMAEYAKFQEEQSAEIRARLNAKK